MRNIFVCLSLAGIAACNSPTQPTPELGPPFELGGPVAAGESARHMVVLPTAGMLTAQLTPAANLNLYITDMSCQSVPECPLMGQPIETGAVETIHIPVAAGQAIRVWVKNVGQSQEQYRVRITVS